MSNPTLHHSIIVSAGPVPLEAMPDGVLGVRCCDICSQCQEIGAYSAASAWSHCAWQGRWEFPERGCSRFMFDPAALGDEGLEQPPQ